jgi:hypothetical protein
MSGWTLVARAKRRDLWGRSWINLISEYDAVLRLVPYTGMRETFVMKYGGEIYMNWWSWEARSISEMGLEQTDVVDYFSCCRIEPCDPHQTPFYGWI